MPYKNLILGVSPITKTVFAGRVNKAGNIWLNKLGVTDQFLKCCIEYFEPDTENTISANGEPMYNITVKKADNINKG